MPTEGFGPIKGMLYFFAGVIDTCDRAYDRDGNEYSFYDLKDYTGMDLDDYFTFVDPCSSFLNVASILWCRRMPRQIGQWLLARSTPPSFHPIVRK